MKKTKINVLHIAHNNYLGGAGRVVNRIHTTMNKSNYFRSVLLVKKKDINNFDDINVIYPKDTFFNKVKRYFEYLLAKIFIKKKESIVSLNLLASNIIDSVEIGSFDAIFLHWTGRCSISIAEINSLLNKNIPTYWYLHDYWVFSGTKHYYKNTKFNYTVGNRLDKYIFELKKKSFQKQNLSIVTPSSYLRTLSKKSSITKKLKHNILSYPLDLKEFYPTSEKIARQKLNLKKEFFYIGFGADYPLENYVKGFSYLSNIELNKNWKIILFSKKIDKKFYKFYNPKDFILVKNNSIHLRYIYSALNITCIPSRMENYPLIACESLACGTPVVGFSDTGLKDIIQKNNIGELASRKKKKSLFSAITKIEDNIISNRLNYKKNCRDFAIKNFNEDFFSEKLYKIMTNK